MREGKWASRKYRWRDGKFFKIGCRCPPGILRESRQPARRNKGWGTSE